MTLMVDGKEYPAKLLNADEARRVYESRSVRKNHDPALLEWMGTGMFKTSVFPVPPGAKRTVTLRYSQICRKTQGLTEFLFPLSTAKYTSHPVEKVSVGRDSSEPRAISRTSTARHTRSKSNVPTIRALTITYTATNEVPSSDFRLMYDVGDQQLAASVLSYRPDTSDEGYFLLLASPEIKRPSDTPMPKTVVFVVDRSGSMSGKKIDQAKGALKFVLNNLHKGDLFNIIAYDSRVESFKPELQRYDDQTRSEALGYVEGIYAGGSTNIDGALQAALAQLQDKERPAYVVFLTDGLPTAGERRESKIVDNAKQVNNVHARLFTFGVGYDVNSRLLDRLSRVCFGQSQYVRPNEDIEAAVAQLYRRIGAPALVDLSLSIDLENLPPEKGSPVSRIYPHGDFDLFAGDQLVMVGRYKQSGNAKVTIRGKVDGVEQTFDFPAQLVEHSTDDSQAFVEKLWALRRVGEIIDEIDMHGKNQELINELVALATKHGILTPYTSFLADETLNVRDLASNRRRADTALDALRLETGAQAFGQRLLKSNYRSVTRAPQSGFAEGVVAAPAGLPALGSGSPADAGNYPGAGAGGRISGTYGGTTPRGYGGAMPGPDTGPTAVFGRGSGSAGLPTGAPGAARGGRRIAEAEVDKTTVVPTVLNVGKKTFFWRNDRWEDSTLTEKQLKNVKKLKRFSQEYFDLSVKLGKDAAKYLAIEGDVVVVLGDTAYEF